MEGDQKCKGGSSDLWQPSGRMVRSPDLGGWGKAKGLVC